MIPGPRAGNPSLHDTDANRTQRLLGSVQEGLFDLHPPAEGEGVARGQDAAAVARDGDVAITQAFGADRDRDVPLAGGVAPRRPRPQAQQSVLVDPVDVDEQRGLTREQETHDDLARQQRQAGRDGHQKKSTQQLSNGSSRHPPPCAGPEAASTARFIPRPLMSNEQARSK